MLVTIQQGASLLLAFLLAHQAVQKFFAPSDFYPVPLFCILVIACFFALQAISHAYTNYLVKTQAVKSRRTRIG